MSRYYLLCESVHRLRTHIYTGSGIGALWPKLARGFVQQRQQPILLLCACLRYFMTLRAEMKAPIAGMVGGRYLWCISSQLHY